MSPTPSTPKRRLKTPAERAQEALDVAERAVERLEHKAGLLKGQLETVTTELQEAQRRRNYLAQNPDLPAQPTTEES